MAKPTLPDFTSPSTITWGWLKTVLTNRIPALMTAFFSTMKDNGVFKDEHLPINTLNPSQFDEALNADGSKMFTIKTSILGSNTGTAYNFTTWMNELKARPGYDAANPSSVVLDGNINWVPRGSTGGVVTTTPLTAPVLQTATGVDHDSATLSWTSVANATSYTIMLKYGSAAWAIKQVVGSVNTATFNDLPSSTVIDAKLYASSSNSTYTVSPDSNIVSFTTPSVPVTTPGAIPTFSMTSLANAADWSRVDNTLVRAGDDFTATGGGHAFSTKKIAAGQSGVFQATVPRANYASGVRLGMANNTGHWEFYYTLFVDPNNIVNATDVNTAGIASGGMTSASGTNPTMTLRYRVDATTVFFDYSKDEGTTWVNFGSTARPNADLWGRLVTYNATAVINNVSGNNLV